MAFSPKRESFFRVAVIAFLRKKCILSRRSTRATIIIIVKRQRELSTGKDAASRLKLAFDICGKMLQSRPRAPLYKPPRSTTTRSLLTSFTYARKSVQQTDLYVTRDPHTLYSARFHFSQSNRPGQLIFTYELEQNSRQAARTRWFEDIWMKREALAYGNTPPSISRFANEYAIRYTYKHSYENDPPSLHVRVCN